MVRHARKPRFGTLAPSQAEPVDAPRILSLKLHTSTPLNRVKNFYHGMLDFPVVEEASNQITFLAGSTNLMFVKVGQKSEAPPDIDRLNVLL